MIQDVERRFFTCQQLLQRQEKGFLHRIVTSDEKGYITAIQRGENLWDYPVMLLRRRLDDGGRELR